MQGDLDADYKLIRDIDASETETWNEITSDEFKTSLSNGVTTELNYVASESTINVVNKSGVDVTFTTNAGNDSITIDDTDYDSKYEEFTISYDLATPSNQGFNPVGTYEWAQANTEFTGSFDGQNHTISNLSINRLYDDYVGLFGTIGSSAEVENIGILYADINSYKSFVGSLVGSNYGTVSNSYSTGNVSGDNKVGGLLGISNGTVSNSYSTGNVTGESDYVGGLVGNNSNGNISNSYSTGNVIGGNRHVGGLVGRNSNNGNISNSNSTGNVTGEYNVGGLVGSSRKGNISNSYSTGNVTGYRTVGGLVGDTNYDIVSNSYSTGSVTGDYSVGGLVGYNFYGTVSNSYSTGNVTGEVNSVGGLIGYSRDGNISNSYWDTEATGQSSSAGLPDSNGLTTSQMQGSSASSNMNFEFTSTWSTVTGDYPELKWQE
jgi:hypothetical protein